ncbi:MAG: hypothetical protein PHV85_06555 [Desulfovibrionaceae bacterium]|nr:hypothetical protein [Desulfovibrionaceae bacterium]MDD4952192.1 hypothetical protein [Desulfovibrionaceae bacterium]
MKKLLFALALVLSMTALAFAGAKTGDITVDSKVDKVTNVGMGMGVKAETNVHSVDVKDGSKTGDITIKGKAGQVTNVGMGMGVESKTNVGSVKVGGK